MVKKLVDPSLLMKILSCNSVLFVVHEPSGKVPPKRTQPEGTEC